MDNDKIISSVERWKEQNKILVNELLVPIGMVIILVVSCWIASR